MKTKTKTTLNDYRVGLLLGKNGDRECYLAKKEGKTFCMKVITLMSNDEKAKASIKNEIKILKKLQSHQNIIFYENCFLVSKSNVDKVVIITEEMPMNLKQFLDINGGKLKEETCKRIAFQLLDAIQHCHQNKVVHQDIKLDNILIDPTSLKTKLIDFGLSSLFKKSKEMKKMAVFKGTPIYANYEKLIETKYDGTKSDVWSCGVTIFKLITGKFPFGETANYYDELVESIKSDKLVFPKDVSPLLVDLLQNMLRRDQEFRYSASESLNHPFFKNDPVFIKTRRSSRITVPTFI
jgi:serine/threonine protein kinase